jgi:transcriptional regulator with XRE-family HTH domain
MAALPMMELFAGELRRLRTAAGLSQEALADRVRYSPSLVAAVEQCRRAPRMEFAQQCDEALGGDGLLLRIREAMLRESLVPWFREWVEIEQEAQALRSFQPLVLPGLLQTADYARGLYEAGNPMGTDEIEQAVMSRIARQEILDRARPPQFVAVVDHTVLERSIGGPKVMRDQLLHLAEAAERPNVHFHVVPKGAGGYFGLSGAFVIATTAEGNDVAYLDNPLKGTVVDRATDVLFMRRAWELVRAEALPQRQTLALISEAVKQWT